MASPAPHHRRWEIKDLEGITTINVLDKKLLDEESLSLISGDLLRLVDERGLNRIVLDFSRVDFISSAALGKLLSLHRKLQSRNGQLVIVNVAKEIADFIKIIKLDRILTIVNTHAFFGAGLPKPTPQRPNDTAGLPDSAPTDVPPEEPPLTGALTADEIRHLDAQGLTLEDAIRNIEASWE